MGGDSFSGGGPAPIMNWAETVGEFHIEHQGSLYLNLYFTP